MRSLRGGTILGELLDHFTRQISALEQRKGKVSGKSGISGSAQQVIALTAMDCFFQRQRRSDRRSVRGLWLLDLIRHKTPFSRSFRFRAPGRARSRERSQHGIDEIIANFDPGETRIQMIVENPPHLCRLTKDAPRHGYWDMGWSRGDTPKDDARKHS